MVDILIKSDSRYPLNRKRLRESLLSEFSKLKWKGNAEISVAIVGSRKMKSLNNKYRKLDYATNVLSFPLEETDRDGFEKGFVYPQDGKLYLGDVVICYPIAVQQAGKYRKFVDDWIGNLAAHGLEHLLGKHHD